MGKVIPTILRAITNIFKKDEILNEPGNLVLVNAQPGCIRIICRTEDQMDSVMDRMTGRGNCILEEFEEWDEGKDKRETHPQFETSQLMFRTRDLEEKAKGLLAKARNKELLEAGTFKIVSFGTGKFGRILGEIFVSPDAVGHEITEDIDRSSEGLVSINDILISEGHAYEYHGEKKKDFKAEIAKEKAGKKEDLIDKPSEEE